MSEVALSYKIPFVDQVIMPAPWASWLSDRGFKNNNLKNDTALNPAIKWNYAEHGLAPWMQFFYDWRFGDLTGDGQIDFILTCGAQRQIAYRQNGDILWRYEDPTAGFLDIRLDSNFPIADVDGDNQAEVICARKIDGILSLCIVNGQDGSIKGHIAYPHLEHRPHDCRGSIILANVSGGETPTDIVVSWDYGSIAVYNSQLELLWQRVLKHEQNRKHVTMGHTPFPADIDNDGQDEIMVGSCMLDHTGNTLWVAADLSALVTDGHADSVQVVNLEEGAPFNVIMSTGAYCFSTEGDLLWGRDDLKHGQALRVGKIRADVPGKQVIVYEAASRVDPDLPDRVLALTNTGELLWDFAVVGPDMQEGGFGFWLGDWDGDGMVEIFVNQPQQVVILNGYGDILDTIPGHLIYVFDLVGDSRAEAVVLTGIEPGMQLQIVTNNKPNPHLATSQHITHRPTTLAMSNCTRY